MTNPAKPVPAPPDPGRATAAERMAERLEQFRALRARGALYTEVTEQLATEAASDFLTHYRERSEYLGNAVALLAEIATLEEPCLSQPGERATFPFLIERLSDSFDPAYCDLYDRAFAQMITLCRSLPAAADLDAALRRFGLASERALLERKARLRRRPPLLDARKQANVRKVLVLSRVTLGADVAITSVVLQKARQMFPQAERVLVGSAKLGELFGGDASLRVREVRYETAGGLLDRLRSWLPLLAAVDEESKGLRPDEILLLDPDSRLLQLGLLPALGDESGYFFFESRRYGEGSSESLSELTRRWLNEQFGGGAGEARGDGGAERDRQDQVLPAVSLRESDRAFARELCGKLRQGVAKHLVAVSFGVGGNSEKRLPDPFERSLLRELLQSGCTVLLDKGAGGEEAERATRLAEDVKNGGLPVLELDAESAASAPDLLRCRMLAWQSGIGAFSALTAECDEYVGYDSAGQHIAAALGVPTISVFSRIAPQVFRNRWRPTGPGVSKLVAELASDGAARPTAAVLREVIELHRQILAGR